MINEFRELADRLAKGMNFANGTVVLITAQGLEDNHLFCKGKSAVMLMGACRLLRVILANTDDDTWAHIARNAVREELIADMERRRQKGETI